MKKAKHGLQEISTWYCPRLFTSLVGALLKAKNPIFSRCTSPSSSSIPCYGPFVHDAITVASYLKWTGLFLEDDMSLQPSRSSLRNTGLEESLLGVLICLSLTMISSVNGSSLHPAVIGCRLLSASGIAVFLLTGSCYLKLVCGDYRFLHLQCKVPKLLLWSKLLSGPLCHSVTE